MPAGYRDHPANLTSRILKLIHAIGPCTTHVVATRLMTTSDQVRASCAKLVKRGALDSKPIHSEGRNYKRLYFLPAAPPKEDDYQIAQLSKSAPPRPRTKEDVFNDPEHAAWMAYYHMPRHIRRGIAPP